MKFDKQNKKWFIDIYLSVDENALKNGGDYLKFKSVMHGRDIEDEDMPSRATFFRWFKERRTPNPTRVGVASFQDAMNMTEDELLKRLLEGTANYEELEGWTVRHKLDGIWIDGRQIHDVIEPFYPPQESTIATSLIKAFFTGYLLARRKSE